MRLSHKEKVRIAKALRTRYEIRNHIPIFSSMGWIQRKVSILRRIYGKPEVAITTKKEVRLRWYQRLLKWFNNIFK
jgi:hypothetical protein